MPGELVCNLYIIANFFWFCQCEYVNNPESADEGPPGVGEATDFSVFPLMMFQQIVEDVEDELVV